MRTDWRFLAGAAVVYFVARGLMAWRERKTPARREWELDEGVAAEDEAAAEGLLARHGKEELAELPEGMRLEQNVRAFAERWATLEFDEWTRDYDRAELLQGECREAWGKGFYCIGGDGGEILFLVRKSAEDGQIYAFDMEGSARPEPYAGNVRRFVAMRYAAGRKTGEEGGGGRETGGGARPPSGEEQRLGGRAPRPSGRADLNGA